MPCLASLHSPSRPSGAWSPGRLVLGGAPGGGMLDGAGGAHHAPCEGHDGLRRTVVVSGDPTGLAGPPARHRAFVGGSPLSIGWRTDDVLAGIARGEHADRREEELVADLARSFGAAPAALGAAESVHWGREHPSGGTYVAFSPGQLVRHGPHLRRPHGAVYFAGAERSSWPDQMEGAVESGIDIARRVLADLRRPRREGANR